MLIETLVASQDIPFGTFLKPNMVVKSQIQSYLANSNAVEDLQEVDGLRTIVPIPKNKPIVYTQFSPTEKAQAPIESHSPQNYTLAVDENQNTGKLFKPGTNFSFLGKPSLKINEVPLAVFKKVQLVYSSQQPLKPFGYAKNSTLLFTITPAQAENLKKLSGHSLRLLLKGLNGDEIISIVSVND